MTAGDGTFRSSESRQSYWRVAIAADQIEILERLVCYFSDLWAVDLEVQGFDGGTGSEMLKVESRRPDSLLRVKSAMECPRNNDYDRGWLAGMFDAEGSSGSYLSSGRKLSSLTIGNTDHELLGRVVDAGVCLGFDFRVEAYVGHCGHARLYGDVAERGRFFGMTQPALSYKTDSCLGHRLLARESPVTGLSALGNRELIDIQTSTRTFMANGFVTHNCYAESLANRYGWSTWGPKGARKRTSASYWRKPLSWNRKAEKERRRHRVFCASLADVFDSRAPEGAREDLWPLIRETPNLDWLLLTKRPQSIERMLPDDWGFGYKNVWLGISAEDQNHYDLRWPILAAVPAAIRFISYEPALGPISMKDHSTYPDLSIYGGESGPGARTNKPEWARQNRDECAELGVAFFFKQWGTYLSNPLVREVGMTTAEARKLDKDGKGGGRIDGEIIRQIPPSALPVPGLVPEPEPQAALFV
ncbi:MAG: DUF5131 family protein [Acidobacteria bacterium]|nr:DUF5131 family protein [Acidobacteriota bacterium]